MLKTLLIENYGLIDRAEIQIAPGATMFTGETGSGKTMVVGAIAFALGERASVDAVRAGAGRASVILTLEPDRALRERMHAAGYAVDADEDAILSRELSDAGKSVVRLNGRQTTTGTVRELAPYIADMIGQHEAQRLLAPAYHQELLDRYGGPELLAGCSAVREAYDSLSSIDRELADLSEREGRAQAEADFAQFAADEITRAAIVIGEDERLSERRRYLDNVERISGALKTAHASVSSDQGAADALGAAEAALSTVASIDRDLNAMRESARALQEETSELAVCLLRKLEETEFNPNELEEINARLDLLSRLKKKYGGTLEAVLASAEKYASLIDAFSTRSERRDQLSHERSIKAQVLTERASALSELRSAAAARLGKRVQSEFSDLAMAAGRFSVGLQPLEAIGESGAETIEFLFSANAGEPLRPLSKVASGGELSRVLLALIVTVMQARDRTALIFDEIDVGIGGVTAAAVAARLARLSKSAQVLCVTHLAQIASWADRHYMLEKVEHGNKTTIEVREAGDRSDRAGELARMLSGEKLGAALKHAEALLKATRRNG